MFKFSRKHQRTISIALLLILVQSFLPSSLMALTSGPSQPETGQFAPAGMDNMVDPFTGDFSYNIPLLDVGGYPINLNYAAGITPDAEASWVGLGWNLNVGAITRNMRGLPDDFSGDQVSKAYNVKPNQTFGVTATRTKEIYGAEIKAIGTLIKKAKLSLSATISYNNYNGFALSVGASPSIEAGAKSKPNPVAKMGVNASVGSETGLEVTPTVGLSRKSKKENDERTLGASLSFPFSTREGLKGMTLSGSFQNESKSAKYNTAKSVSGSMKSGEMGSFMGFVSPTYTPSMEHNTYNVNATLKIDFSKTSPAADGKPFGFIGFYSGEFLKEVERSVPAYGYMYSGVSPSEDILMDFNREKDGAFNEFTTNLPVTNYTYDVFNVSGQGVSGSYRLYRGDVGAVHDPSATSQGYAPGLGIEFGAGTPPSAKVGVDVSYNQSNSHSGVWPSDATGVKSFISEAGAAVNSPGTEMAYFKRVGEMSPETDVNYLNTVQINNKTVRHGIKKGTKFLGDGELSGTYIDKDAGVYAIPGGNQRTARRVRTTPFTTLLASEASSANVLPIQNYSINNFNWQKKTGDYRSPNASDATIGYAHSTINRVSGGKQAHHISEIRVTDNSGARYIYGIPAYNNYQEDVTFAVSQPGNSSIISGIVPYGGGDNSKGNTKGLDHYYNKVVTPPYAHSYLLTTVLSADYVDRDFIPGPSDGDLGNYTKFNYVKASDQFKWRTPFSAGGNEGSYSQGMLGTGEDDKANYVYGEKEVWYLHSIETRTHVAEFYLKDREDGMGVVGKDGGIGGDKQKYIDKIVLYSKPDKQNSKAEPVKVVHFEYDYSLCPNVPNNSGNAVMADNNGDGTAENINIRKGKLTLKKVWFTYGNSQKGVLNPYVFNYADQNFNGTEDADLNPVYGIKNYDRWGNYKLDSASKSGDVKDSNAEFPYTTADKSKADRSAAVYALSTIQTPTGGTIRAYYESDDYAYVQNQRAMRMFKLTGCSDNANPVDDGNSQIYEIGNHKQFLVVDLAEGFQPSDAYPDPNTEFRQKYLSGISPMYFKVHLRVLSDGARDEFVPGYAEIDPNNSLLVGSPDANGYYHRAKIKVRRVDLKGETGPVNPITKTGWMYARMNLPREVMGSASAGDGGVEQVLRSVLSALESVAQIFTGFAEAMLLKSNSKSFTPNRSFVRLNEPDKIKMGGGHRVKAIVMVDNWGLMQSSRESAVNQKQTSFYGQKYDYSYNENGQTISAGVAAYEPIMGGDENPYRLPVAQVQKVPLAPDKEYYMEAPFGESFFPSPTVGYRQVVVTPIKVVSSTIDVDHLNSNGTGAVQHEFYTAYDFPTVVHYTNVELKRHKPNILFKFMKFDSKDLITCSQGYYIELNDMHGKQKAQRVYPDVSTTLVPGQQPTPISEVEYTYKTNATGTLNNQVTYINPDLSITREGSGQELGVDIDMVQDQRFSESKTLGGGLGLNFKYVQIGIVPLFVPTAFPDITNEGTRFRSVVDTKVVNKYGILETTTAKENGASITTKNLAWDSKTGQVLLTQTENEFHDPIYNFTYPGHWAYPRMGLAAENEGLTFNNFPLVASALKDGDEVASSSITGFYHVQDLGGGNKQLLDKSGAVQSLSSGKVIRSGARNDANAPVGTVATLINPIKAGNTTVAFDKVLNAGVNEFKEGWQRFCNCDAIGQTTNPFVLGLQGNLRPFRNWTYLTNRTQSTLNDNLGIRKDGTFTDFTPFWVYNTNVLSPISTLPSTKWQFISRVEKYNPIGMAIEEKDALGRYSMSLYSYGRNLQVATSNNSQYRETGFDGFEDYDFGDCADDHMSWRAFTPNVTNVQAHTGRKSIAVPSNQRLTINKVIVVCP